MNNIFKEEFEKTASFMSTMKGLALPAAAVAGLAGMGAGLGHISAPTVDGIEDHLMVNLDRASEMQAEQLLDQARQDSVIQRARKMTGALSLGLVPAMSSTSIERSIANKIRRNSPAIQEAIRIQGEQARKDAMVNLGANTAVNLARIIAHRTGE